MTDVLPESLQTALDQLLRGAAGVTEDALDTMGASAPSERAALDAAIEAGRAQIAVTMLLPSGAVRVTVVGEWAGQRGIWEMVPDSPVQVRALNS